MASVRRACPIVGVSCAYGRAMHLDRKVLGNFPDKRGQTGSDANDQTDTPTNANTAAPTAHGQRRCPCRDISGDGCRVCDVVVEASLNRPFSDAPNLNAPNVVAITKCLAPLNKKLLEELPQRAAMLTAGGVPPKAFYSAGREHFAIATIICAFRIRTLEKGWFNDASTEKLRGPLQPSPETPRHGQRRLPGLSVPPCPRSSACRSGRRV